MEGSRTAPSGADPTRSRRSLSTKRPGRVSELRIPVFSQLNDIVGRNFNRVAGGLAVAIVLLLLIAAFG